MIGGPPRKGGKQKQGHELQQTDQRELPGCLRNAQTAVTGNVVGLPSDDQHHRILRQCHRQSRDEIGAEIRDAQWRGFGRKGVGFVHPGRMTGPPSVVKTGLLVLLEEGVAAQRSLRRRGFG